jgi:flagellar basal body-associated protein FliL
MDIDAGGLLWLMIDVIMVAALAAGLIYGTVSWRRRRRISALVSGQATKRLYEQAAAEERARDSKQPTDKAA